MSKYYAEGSDLTAIANAIRTKGGTTESLEFPDGFVSAIGDINAGSSGLTLLGSGTYTKTSASSQIQIPVTWGTGTPKICYFYNTTPPDSTDQTILAYSHLLDNSDLSSYLPYGEAIEAMRTRDANNTYNWAATPRAINLDYEMATMGSRTPETSMKFQAGTWKWFIYGEESPS